MKKYWIWFLLWINIFIGQGQTQIKGKITEVEGFATPNAMVVLYNDSNNKMLEHTQSNQEGRFSLTKTYDMGIYKLEVSKLGYQKQSQQIVIGTESKQNIDLKVVLHTKSTEIKELTLTGVRPIIVKQDTVIYDVGHFTETHDNTLEEVLARIKGFKILPNGDIEVEGKVVRKVLIDGKEVSDLGAAMVTKSLSPDKVKNVEVRFDEKNARLKESLLDGGKFVVLDISLKENVKKSFFGKQQLTIGYQNKPKIGGMTNVFSLNPKVNIQFFAENNNFGTNEIELFMIRNIGDEAFAKMFKSNVVDYDEIKKEEAYHNEIYGFSNYTANDNAIVGFSINVPLSKKADLYVGSFSNYHYLTNQFLQQSWFDRDLVYDFQENNFLNEYNTKNKVQIKYTANKWKWNADANYVYTDQNVGNNIRNQYFNRFRKKHFSNNWYFNNHLEYVITPKLGLLSALSYSQEHYNIYSRLYTNHEEIYSFLGVRDLFAQQNKNVQSMGNAKIGLFYKSENWGTHSMGYRYYSNHLENEKISNSVDFNSEERTYKSNGHTLYYDHNVYWGDLEMKTDLSYSFVDFPYQENGSYAQKNKEYFQYKFNGRYKFNRMFSLKAEYENQLQPYPLSKATFGDVLMDFQTIYRTRQEIAPFNNKLYQLSFDMDFGKDKGWWIIYASGKSANQNNQSFNENFIFTEANQLSSKYHLFSSTYKDKIRKWNFQYILEPEFIFNTSEYVRNNQVEQTTTYRYLAGLKLFYTPKNKKVSVFYYPKYSHFMFKNTTTEQKTNFNFLSNKIELNLYFMEQKLKAEIGYKQVNFLQNGNSFNNLDVQLVYKTAKHKWFLNAGNLFNSKNFTTQDFNQSLLNIHQNRVFDRYVNVGFEMKIN